MNCMTYFTPSEIYLSLCKTALQVLQWLDPLLGNHVKGGPMDDQETLKLFRNAVLHQDQSAWHHIWEHCQPGVKAHIWKELAGWVASDELDDLTQTVFLKFWQDTCRWTSVTHLYSINGKEGILSRLHSTAIYAIQKFRQKYVRKWIPVIRSNYSIISDSEKEGLQQLAESGISEKYRGLFLRQLAGAENTEIAVELNMTKKEVSTGINRAWERFVYVMLKERRRNPGFDPLFQRLISPGVEV